MSWPSSAREPGLRPVRIKVFEVYHGFDDSGWQAAIATGEGDDSGTLLLQREAERAGVFQPEEEKASGDLRAPYNT